MTYTANILNVMPVPAGEPGVLTVRVFNSAAESNVPVYVPWTFCRLAYAYAAVTEAIDATGAMEIDLELNAASGTEMMSISIAKSSDVGTIAEATVTSASACRALDRTNTSRDAVNIEVDGSAAAAGSADIIMYFERDDAS